MYRQNSVWRNYQINFLLFIPDQHLEIRLYSLLFLISELRKLNLIKLTSIKRLRSILSWNEFEEHNEWQIEKNYIYVYISFKNQFLQQVNYGYDLTYSEVSDSNFGTIADESSIWDARTAPISCSGNSSGVLP